MGAAARARRNSKVLLYDASGWTPEGTSKATQAVLTTAWTLGTRLFSGKSIGAEDWPQAYELLREHQARTGVNITQLHVWGHGLTGQPLMGGTGCLLNPSKLKGACPHLHLVWWRSCSVHANPKYAELCARKLNAYCVGHCEAISWPNPLRQVSVCGIRPGEEAHWHRTEKGVWVSHAKGFKDDQVVPLPSVFTGTNRVPVKRGVWKEPK